MRAFEHIDATSPAEAIELLGADPRARPIAGGTDLIPELRLGIHEPDRLINLKPMSALAGIHREADQARIGALTLLADVAADKAVKTRLPLLVEAIGHAASPQVRNAATLGGSLCQESRCWYFRGQFHCWLKGGTCCDAEHGDNRYQAILGGGPCFTVQPSDTATALVALRACAAIASPRGQRTVPLDQFFTRPTASHRALTCLGHDEIVESIAIPWPESAERGVFLKAMERAEFGFALASVACVVAQENGQVKDARIILGGVAPVPWRATAAEDALRGKRLDQATIARAGDLATEGAQPLSMNAYKVPLTQALVRQALERLAAGPDGSAERE